MIPINFDMRVGYRFAPPNLRALIEPGVKQKIMVKSKDSASSLSHGYSPEHLRQFRDRLHELRHMHTAVQLNLSDLAGQLTVERARTFANQALGRRLQVIERSVLNIFNLYPPSRHDLMTRDECTDVEIQFHTFAINVYAVFDNVAWICVLEAGGNVRPSNIGLFKEDFKAFLPPALLSYVERPTIKEWFRTYGKVYRDSTAHRIPPYLPSRVYSPEEGDRWQALHKESMTVLNGWVSDLTHDQTTERLARHEQLEDEKDQLGHNSLMVALTLTGEDALPPILLHPQLLADWGLVHEFVDAFLQALRGHYGWPAPIIPRM